MEKNAQTRTLTDVSLNYPELSIVERTSAALRDAGLLLLQRFSRRAPREKQLDEVVHAIFENDSAVLPSLRKELLAIVPEAKFIVDEEETGALPPGMFWVVDPVEGNINHVQGLDDWAVTATLVRDNESILTVIYLPSSDDLYTAIRGRGAFQDGQPLSISGKTDLNAALVGTGQAKPGEDHQTYRRMGESVTAMLQAALLVRVSVPSTLQLIHVAAGRMDVFWQFSQVRAGLLAGALLVCEAGGVTTDTRGLPWTLASPDFVASGPALQEAACDVLATIGSSSFAGGEA